MNCCGRRRFKWDYRLLPLAPCTSILPESGWEISLPEQKRDRSCRQVVGHTRGSREGCVWRAREEVDDEISLTKVTSSRSVHLFAAMYYLCFIVLFRFHNAGLALLLLSPGGVSSSLSLTIESHFHRTWKTLTWLRRDIDISISRNSRMVYVHG